MYNIKHTYIYIYIYLTPKEKGYFSGTKIRAKIHSKYELWLESSSCCPWRSLFGL